MIKKIPLRYWPTVIIITYLFIPVILTIINPFFVFPDSLEFIAFIFFPGGIAIFVVAAHLPLASQWAVGDIANLLPTMTPLGAFAGFIILSVFTFLLNYIVVRLKN